MFRRRESRLTVLVQKKPGMKGIVLRFSSSRVANSPSAPLLLQADTWDE